MTRKLFGHFHDPLLRRTRANSDRGCSQRSAPEHPIVRTAQGASRCLARRDRPAATQALSQASDPTLRSGEPGAKPVRANNFRRGGKERAPRWINVSSKFPPVTRSSLQSSSTWETLVVAGGSTAGRQHPRQLSRNFITNKPKNFRRSLNGPNTLLCIYWRLPQRSVAIRWLWLRPLKRRSAKLSQRPRSGS
jgi:hypothetical protein